MERRPPDGLGSRDRILWAAASMLGDDPGAALSVRAVAARAEVSTGSLRHHFPTQRALLDAALTVVYDYLLPDDSLRDNSLPARDRLISHLRGLLAPGTAVASPDEAWPLVFDRYVRNDPTEDARTEYVAIERQMRRRIEHFLTVLQDEGAVPEGDNARRARFLITVLNGLSLAQALPADEPLLRTEGDTLHLAVDAILGPQD
ncbi:TetR/AcrR family transcriptional regulator [Aeromicrobium sp. CF4.19]|uniref:TetR/AcrR family transcriptional regulator n=1 Tax=Aeromicrobium sp. CF4.19 TaxID=3373082 RepID=UPI003EE74C86